MFLSQKILDNYFLTKLLSLLINSNSSIVIILDMYPKINHEIELYLRIFLLFLNYPLVSTN